MKTLYMADLDGTLLNSAGQLSEYTKTTLNALIERGLPFTINTSRSPKSAKSVIGGLKLKLPIILMNGSLFLDTASGLPDHTECIGQADARTALATCLKMGAEPFLFSLCGEDVEVQYRKCTTPESQAFLESRQGYYKSCEQVADYKVSKNTPYILCVGDHAKLTIIKNILNQLKGIHAIVYSEVHNRYSYLEIYSKNAGKGESLTVYKKKYGFQRVVAFGDNLNDIPMLEAADFGVAVANGYRELKAMADLEIDSCDKDAVANYLLMEWARDPKLY